ncbi:MAG: hypothetical protein HYV48_04020, partial [Candidatus Omnitrophica bacterium]|nr:hypothetical protein [Candidatus Omnitrophota bacterium]
GGADVSKAMELGRQAREAEKSGDREKTTELIDEAMALLKEPETEPAEEPGDTTESGEIAEHKRGKEITVEMKVNSDTVTVTSAVAGVNSGKEVIDLKSVFPARTLKSADGKVAISISSIPVFIEEVTGNVDTSGIDAGEVSLNSPYGGDPTAELKDITQHYMDIGVKWIRYSGRLMAWDIIEKEKGKFDWSLSDAAISEPYKKGLNIVFTVRSYNRWDQPMRKLEKGKVMEPLAPSDLEAFLKFLTKAVERYDGDGIDDAPGSPVVNYWQIENEVDGNFWGDTSENYAKLLHASYNTIKKNNPENNVLIAGASNVKSFYGFYIQIFKALRDIQDSPESRCFDILDIHWYGNAGDYKGIEGHDLITFVKDMKKTLSDYGYSNIPIWFTETGTYGGREVVGKGGKPLSEQDEVTHAAELVKRYVHFIANGVSKVFWTQMVEIHHASIGIKNDYFENLGIINNPRNDGDSSKKLAYFSCKFMTDKIEGSKWEKTENINLGKGIYVYRFSGGGRVVYVLWYDEAKQNY